jgi:hypothetical protein
MTPSERASLAEMILTNPLFGEVFDGLEHAAIEAMIYAKDDETRFRASLRVREIRSFRQDCEAALRNTPPKKGAVA